MLHLGCCSSPRSAFALLKKIDQTRQIISLLVVNRYNFHYLKKLFIKSFSLSDKINFSIKGLGIITWSIWGISKSKVCVKTLLVFSNKLYLKLVFSSSFIKKSVTVEEKLFCRLYVRNYTSDIFCKNIFHANRKWQIMYKIP